MRIFNNKDTKKFDEKAAEIRKDAQQSPGAVPSVKVSFMDNEIKDLRYQLGKTLSAMQFASERREVEYKVDKDVEQQVGLWNRSLILLNLLKDADWTVVGKCTEHSQGNLIRYKEVYENLEKNNGKGGLQRAIPILDESIIDQKIIVDLTDLYLLAKKAGLSQKPIDIHYDEHKDKSGEVLLAVHVSSGTSYLVEQKHSPIPQEYLIEPKSYTGNQHYPSNAFVQGEIDNWRGVAREYLTKVNYAENNGNVEYAIHNDINFKIDTSKSAMELLDMLRINDWLVLGKCYAEEAPPINKDQKAIFYADDNNSSRGITPVITQYIVESNLLAELTELNLIYKNAGFELMSWGGRYLSAITLHNACKYCKLDAAVDAGKEQGQLFKMLVRSDYAYLVAPRHLPIPPHGLNEYTLTDGHVVWLNKDMADQIRSKAENA